MNLAVDDLRVTAHFPTSIILRSACGRVFSVLCRQSESRVLGLRHRLVCSSARALRQPRVSFARESMKMFCSLHFKC